FSVDRISIEENTGEGNGQNGESGNGEEGEGEAGEGNEGEGGEDDIVLAGPFTFDVSGGSVVLASVPVFPGTFMKADVAFRVDPQHLPPASIRCTGQYVPAGGSPIPFMLSSAFAPEIEVPIANGGV